LRGGSPVDTVLIYIHGFNSSARSFKARLLHARMEALGRGSEFVCPDLPDRPLAAIAVLESLLARHPRSALVGSSLGGYYATWLAETHALKAVLVNPAVRPYALLRGYLGPQANLYSGRKYELTETHLAGLEALEVDRITPDRYLLVVATGDEVLDYREALERYTGCERRVIEGSDHGFGDFERCVDAALAFCGIPGG
jgi:uncharacterized protein